MLVVAVVLFGVSVIAATAALILRRKANDLAGRAKITLDTDTDVSVAAFLNTDVIVEGVATGTPVESPWSRRQGLAFEAVRVYEHRDREGKTSTRSSNLGTHMQEMSVAGSSPQAPVVSVSRSTQISILNFPKISLSNNMIGDLLGKTQFGISLGGVSIGGGSDRVEEVAVVPGDKIWVVGKFERNPAGGLSVTGDKIVVSGSNGESMESSYKKQALIAFVLSGVTVITSIVLGVLSALG